MGHAIDRRSGVAVQRALHSVERIAPVRSRLEGIRNRAVRLLGDVMDLRPKAQTEGRQATRSHPVHLPADHLAATGTSPVIRLSHRAASELVVENVFAVAEINPTLADFEPTDDFFALAATMKSRPQVSVHGDAVHLVHQAQPGTPLVAEIHKPRGEADTVHRMQFNLSHSRGIRFFVSAPRGARSARLLLNVHGPTLKGESASPRRSPEETSPAVFAAEFALGQGLREVVLPWRAFGQISGNPTMYQVDRENRFRAKLGFDGHHITNLGFVVHATERQTDVALTLHGPIEPDRSLDDATERTPGETLWDLLGRELQPPDGDGYREPLYSAHGIAQTVSSALRDPKRRANAAATIHAGRAVQVLKERGFGVVALPDKKLSFDRFFRQLADGSTPVVPVETGDFGHDHVPWAHVAQVLAITEGMTPKELAAFRRFFCRLEDPDGWRFWDMYFDAQRGLSSARSWRPLIGDVAVPADFPTVHAYRI